MTLSAPLADNLNNAVISPVDFYVTLPGAGTLGAFEEVAPNSQSLMFSTNGQGQITSWAIDVRGGGGGNVSAGNGITDMGFASSQVGDAMNFGMAYSSDSYTGSVVSIAAASAGAGAWFTDTGGETIQVSTSQAPEIDGSGAIGALTLCGLALAVIQGRRRMYPFK